MKLYRVPAFTGPDGLTLCDEPDPTPPVAGQVIVRLRATSINFRDLMGLQGQLQVGTGMAPNHIPMCDGAGEVVSVGESVTRVKPGDRVALTFHPTWIAGRIPDDFNVLGRSCHLNDGLLAQYTKVDQSEVVVVPNHLSFEEAATLPCAGVTAWAALQGQMHLLAGDDVLVMGTGGVAIFALQLAKAAGARVIATTTSPAKQQRLWELGADCVVDSSRPDWSAAVLDATGGRGVDVALDVGGSTGWIETIKATRECGRISLIGALDRSTGGMPGLFMWRGQHLNPTRVGSREQFEQLNRAIAQAKIVPVIDRVFGFEQAAEAFRYFETASRIGKVVIRID
ncbi:zinc-dependent alcohol dehydrogenase family protein [Novosphingobium taihuense]|uniref:NADPH:quinone reductase-like Zn-dependent oxidoreductase n=1 Tax=Novosphingobium taihuense TaxID=260085 RepID=A0A7W7ADM8_9SPHN|nr:NAD(P)-dependent alcohol dehydrogenase [Novosphingobium taihuense]MBB4615052.1 NADPH:quinone reductase-like Zn-dependent oxidoreductase [Novosphingobium taihuense]TWH79285.1 NADPH:quinone reductase-like Zn-dependent oxidoreductase [Novosphingobium taihuense]